MSNLNPTREEFAALLESASTDKILVSNAIVKGKVIAIEKDMAIIDAGLKVEGRVPLKEFGAKGVPGVLKPGDEVEVYVENIENSAGEAVLSREKARREESWLRLEEKYKAGENVEGIIFAQVKGGYTVDLDGVIAFLPRSQMDTRPIRDTSEIMNVPQTLEILKMDRQRGNIVVSRRSVLEESRAEQRGEIVQNLKEGQIVEGIVKNITDYGAFIDLNGIDGLLHVTDLAWRRINHPSELLSIGQVVKAQIVKINPETHRVSLGMKQLETDPWESVALKHPVGSKIVGRVTNITDYGAFVELDSGIEGLIHVSEMSWTKKNVHPSKILSTSQEVEAVILEIDADKHRISLGLKQTLDNPWENFLEKHPVGSVVEGEVKNKTEFGLFIGLPDDVDGMVHFSDVDWNNGREDALNDYNKGDIVKAVVLDVDVEKERISLGIKQLTEDTFSLQTNDLKRGDKATCEVTAINDHSISVKLVNKDVEGVINRNELSRDRNEQDPNRFNIGDKLDAKITSLDKKTRKLELSIKALEVEEEKKAVEQYGSSDSGASLGDILGDALRRHNNK